VILLLLFYITKFELVCYIPKIAFSSLLVLSSIDLTNSWLVQSFKKTPDRAEWMVTPIIVVCALMVGLLPAVFFGIALSTFIFVAAFYRSGVVKFLATGEDPVAQSSIINSSPHTESDWTLFLSCDSVMTGLTVRSTIERGERDSHLLDHNGDLIQILVLQNYLFFGNASSCFDYVTTMFDESPEFDHISIISSTPRYLIIDFVLVTGMDKVSTRTCTMS